MQEAHNTSSWFNIHDVVLCWAQKKQCRRQESLVGPSGRNPCLRHSIKGSNLGLLLQPVGYPEQPYINRQLLRKNNMRILSGREIKCKIVVLHLFHIVHYAVEVGMPLLHLPEAHHIMHEVQ